MLDGSVPLGWEAPSTSKVERKKTRALAIAGNILGGRSRRNFRRLHSSMAAVLPQADVPQADRSGQTLPPLNSGMTSNAAGSLAQICSVTPPCVRGGRRVLRKARRSIAPFERAHGPRTFVRCRWRLEVKALRIMCRTIAVRDRATGWLIVPRFPSRGGISLEYDSYYFTVKDPQNQFRVRRRMSRCVSDKRISRPRAAAAMPRFVMRRDPGRLPRGRGCRGFGRKSGNRQSRQARYGGQDRSHVNSPKSQVTISDSDWEAGGTDRTSMFLAFRWVDAESGGGASRAFGALRPSVAVRAVHVNLDTLNGTGGAGRAPDARQVQPSHSRCVRRYLCRGNF